MLVNLVVLAARERVKRLGAVIAGPLLSRVNLHDGPNHRLTPWPYTLGSEMIVHVPYRTDPGAAD